MKKIFYIILILISVGGWSLQSEANVCITGTHEAASYTSFFEEDFINGYDIYRASLTCQELDSIGTGLEVASIAFSATGIYAACTGVGLPATVALESGAIALTAISLVISKLDCDNSEEEKLIQEKVDSAVCSALEAQGLVCIPPLLKIEDDFLTI